MKKIVVMLALCLLSASLFAQERVAILPFTGGEGREGDTIAQMLGTELTKLGNFQIVPRTQAINKVIEEQKFQRGGLTDGDTIVALGKGANAKYVVSGHIQNLDNRKMISASILHVETFQQIAGDYYEYDDLGEVRKYLPILAKKLVNETKKDYSGLPTLAILPFDGVNENNADVLAQLLAIELANSRTYVVVSRTTTIENIMKEQNIQRSGLTDSDNISKLGVAMNADYVLYGSASSLGSIGFINATIIDVLTLIQEGGAYVEYETVAEGIELMPQLAYMLTGVLSLNDAIAIHEGEEDISLIKKLLSKGINTSSYGDYTPLMYASLHGYIEIVKALIAEDANIDAKNNKGWTALILASYNGKIESVKELIAGGADLNIKANDGNTALDDASDKRHTAIINLLKAAGAK